LISGFTKALQFHDPMKVDRAKFFKHYRSNLEDHLEQSQVQGYDAIFDYWESSTLNDPRWLAYALATAYHETGRKMQAVREGFCDSDQCSIKAVTRLFEQKRIARNYALPHPNGQGYFGRGLVQITHGNNYETLGRAIGLGMGLYDKPGLALQLEVAVKIMFVGMTQGLFTGKRFADYFNNTATSWTPARRIINGVDKADLIAGYAKKFFKCLS
jgi:predicted chitinase